MLIPADPVLSLLTVRSCRLFAWKLDEGNREISVEASAAHSLFLLEKNHLSGIYS